MLIPESADESTIVVIAHAGSEDAKVGTAKAVVPTPWASDTSTS